MLSGKAKLNDVQQLLARLKDDLGSRKLTQEQRRKALEQLKIYGRDAKDAGPIFTRDGIEVLTKHGLPEKSSSPASLEALRCLANAMLLEPKTRQIFVDLGCAGQVAERLKMEDSDHEFLISRILFLMTYEAKLDFNPLFNDQDLAGSINSHIARHAEQFSQAENKKNEPSAFDQAALSESLKLLFNLSTYYPQRVPTFTPSIEYILRILNHITIPTPPLQPPITYLINALVNLDLQDSHQISNLNNSTINILTTILSKSLATYPPSSLETNSTPLLNLLRRIYASTQPIQKQHIKSLILPQQSDRDLPLGQSDTLPSRLLRLSTSPTAPKLRESISGLLFELSNHDATTFVKNVGYGYAAGFLLSRGIAVPDSSIKPLRRAGRDGEGGGEAAEEDVQDVLVNPITGQKLSKEEEARVDAGPEMSEEEKEREAERLFVLFERLRATGVVSVENPVSEAVERGRFDGGGGDGGGRVEEVDDDD